MTSTTTTTEGDTLATGRPDVRPDHGDHERYAHYVDRDQATESMVLGTPLTALCGKVWVPSRDPSRFPVCPECQELYEMSPEDRLRELNRRFGGGED